jgi:hypothetical protein
VHQHGDHSVCGGDGDEAERNRPRASGERNQPEQPGAAIAVMTRVQSSSQQVDAAAQSRVDRLDRHVHALCNRALRDPVEVAQDQRGAPRLVEREHGIDQAPACVFAKPRIGRRRVELGASHFALAAFAARLAAARRRGDATHDRREPTPHGRHARTIFAERGQPGLLDDVVGAGAVVHQLARQSADEGLVRQQIVDVVWGRFHGSRIEVPPRWFRVARFRRERGLRRSRMNVRRMGRVVLCLAPTWNASSKAFVVSARTSSPRFGPGSNRW